MLINFVTLLFNFVIKHSMSGIICKKTSLFFFCCFTMLAGISQNVKIKGKAHSSHIGKEINLFAYSDLITYTQTKEATDTIDKDGYFELDLQIKYTQAIELRIENLVGKMYIQPDYVYGINFPKKDSTIDIRNDTDFPVEIGVYSNDTTELNTLIIDFNKQYNKVFSTVSYEFLNKNRIYQKVDSLHLISYLRYKKINNSYFKSYVDYALAELNSNASRGKNYLNTKYIQNKPILYDHYEYMAFFNAYFKGYLNAYTSTKSGENIYHLINTIGGYKPLDKFLKNDPELKNDTLRELVLIRNLWDYCFNSQFEKQSVINILEQISEETKIVPHKKIIENILQVNFKLQPGAAAPDFRATDRTGKPVSLKDFKGRYVYLSFFSSKSLNSLKEMPKILDLIKKYGDKMVFVSICTDDSLKSYKDFLKANPKYNWTILFNNSEAKGQTAKDLYNLKGLPAFFFINQYANLAQSPALAPTEGFEYKLKALFKPKKSNRIPGIR